MRIKHFALIAPDYEKLRDFYHKIFALELDFDDKPNKYCQFYLNNNLRVDFENKSCVTAELPDLKKEVKLLLRVETESVDAAYTEIKSKTPVLNEPITRLYNVRNFYLLDPCDNLIEIYQKL